MANYVHLSYEERKNLEDGLNENKSINQISKELNRSHSSLLREIERNKVFSKPGSFNKSFPIIVLKAVWSPMCSHIVTKAIGAIVSIAEKLGV